VHIARRKTHLPLREMENITKHETSPVIAEVTEIGGTSGSKWRKNEE
jgi:hypothetical protein